MWLKDADKKERNVTEEKKKKIQNKSGNSSNCAVSKRKLQERWK